MKYQYVTYYNAKSVQRYVKGWYAFQASIALVDGYDKIIINKSQFGYSNKSRNESVENFMKLKFSLHMDPLSHSSLSCLDYKFNPDHVLGKAC